MEIIYCHSIQTSAAPTRWNFRHLCVQKSSARMKRASTGRSLSGLLRRPEFPGRPVGNLLFLGPTGSGKTRIVEAAAEILFGDARSLIKVDCASFSIPTKSPS